MGVELVPEERTERTARLPAAAAAGPVAPKKKKRHPLRNRAYNFAMRLMQPFADIVTRTSLVPTTPFLRAEDFPWIAPIQGHWRSIRRELEQVLVYRDDLPAFHEINGDATTIRSDDWKTFFFYGFGVRSEANCGRCPMTAALIEKVPGMKTAFFSILGPGVRIPPHTGPWKGFIRYHLGLMIPEPASRCRIVVGGEEAYWEEGKSLVFDDTYVHEVANDTSGTRVILFLDVERPCRFPGWLVNKAVIAIAGLTPFVRDSMRRHRRWERRFEDRRKVKMLSAAP